MVFVAPYEFLSAPIAAAANLSSAVSVEGRTPVAVDMGDAWDAAVITLQAAGGDGVYRNVYTDEGTEVSLTVAASRYVVLTGAQSDALAGVVTVKLRSGTAASPVAQSAGAALYLVCK